MKRWRTTLSLIASLLTLLMMIPHTQGKLQSTSGLESLVYTGSWSTTVNSYNGPSANIPYTITWTGSSRKQHALIAIINNGNYSLSTSHLSYSSVKTNGDISRPPTLTFESCSGIWDPITFNCSGAITFIGSGTTGTVEVSGNISPGNRLIIRLTNQRDASFNYNTTLNSVTYRSDIRTGQVTSS